MKHSYFIFCERITKRYENKKRKTTLQISIIWRNINNENDTLYLYNYQTTNTRLLCLIIVKTKLYEKRLF